MAPKLFIAGDSTAAAKDPSQKPMAGWGEYLGRFLKPPLVIDNRAVNGRSTKSFLDEGRWAAIEQDLRAGDAVLIQFGHNDEKKEDPLRYTDPDTEYRSNLRHFIVSTRNRGATPVLLTSVSRRRFTADGLPDPLAVGPYPAAMREVAAATGTPLLDIFAASQLLYRDLGPEASTTLFLHLPANQHPNYPEGVADDTHFSEEGARQIAKLVADAIACSDSLSSFHRYCVGLDHVGDLEG
ncbi:rhamnogalacturonan acetylesterase [Paenibacillus sp. VCA1]|uniref:rhamnogalacturonan acetylesterase n=1 Tax=Paenibacillus sp. VCA1 TaxID=3039148 RepID=UPI002871F4CD|nr:rhamnogalacturonan acetylesterase [Paenibacillus sp. VCA1]MDR9856300.1 rhamnogalacturonan acetylesterase [Paenibacillus sp. VCA1]